MRFTIQGKILGGKNHVLITRTGHRYPNPKWAIWRDRVVNDLVLQKEPGDPKKTPLRLSVAYTPGDLKRRDSTAILDSLYHCLEKAGIVEDDCLFQDVHYVQMPLDRKNPRVELEISEIK